MSPEDVTPLEAELVSLLAVCDDVLAAGMPATPLGDAGAPAEVRSRLERNLACMQLLRHMWSGRGNGERVEDTPTAQEATPDHGAEAVPTPPLHSLGRFEVRRELGRGGFGIVFLAIDPQLGREVALKVPRTDVLTTAELRARFHHEARTAASLEHPNLVPVFEAGEAGALCYIASAYCPGPTLAEWLRNAEPLPPRDAAVLVATLADAVQHAHSRGVLHRDLKPSNVLLQMQDDKSAISNLKSAIPRITDFGLAKLLADTGADRTHTGVVLGTPHYMAPEQAAGRVKDVGIAADVYALGAILYELLAGRVPFAGATALEVLRQVESAEPVPPSRLRRGVPRDLDVVCLKCLHKEPARRYATAGALADDLRRFLGGEPVHAIPVGRGERAWRWCKRNPWLAGASAIAAVALAAVVVVSIWLAVAQHGFGVAQQRNALELKTALDESEERRIKVDQARRALQRRLAENYLDRGHALATQGKIGPGVLWLARGVQEAAEVEADDLVSLGRMELAIWRRLLGPLRANFTQPRGIVAVAFAADGTAFLTRDNENTVGLWDLATGRSVTPAFPAEVWSKVAAFSADGRFLVSAEPGLVRFWELRTGKPLGPAVTLTAGIAAFAFTPDGQKVVIVTTDWSARVLDTATGTSGPTMTHNGLITAVAISADGRIVATGTSVGSDSLSDPYAQKARVVKLLTNKGGPIGSPPPNVLVRPKLGPTKVIADLRPPSGEARAWEADTGKPLCPPLLHENWVTAVALSPDGRHVLTGSRDLTGRRWEIAGGKPVGASLLHDGPVTAVAYAADGAALVTADVAVRFWDASTGGPDRAALQQRLGVQAFALSPDGHTLLTGGKDGTVRVWDVAPGPQAIPVRHHPNFITVTEFSPDCRTLLTVAPNHAQPLGLWDCALGKARPALANHKAFSAAFSPDGRWLATGDVAKSVRLFDEATGILAGEALQHEDKVGGVVGVLPQDAVSVVAFSPDSQTLLTGSLNTTARLWDVATRKPIGATMSHDAALIAARFSPDGTRIATLAGHLRSAAKPEVRLWDARTGQAVGPVLRFPGQIPHAAAFDAQTTMVLVGSNNSTAQVWDLRTGQALGPPLPHQGIVHAAAFSPDGRKMVTGDDRMARLWETSTGKPLGEPLAHQGTVMDLSFSPDGRLILSASFDRTAQLWDVASGKPVGPPLLHPTFVTRASFSPDGRSIMTLCGGDREVRIWAAPPPLAVPAQQLTLWAQAVTGLELDADNVIRDLDAATWLQRRKSTEDAAVPQRP